MTSSRRSYARSSSFQMALLFTILCGAAVAILGYFSYYFHRGHFVHGVETVIDTEIHYLSRLDGERLSGALMNREDRGFLLLSPSGDKITGNFDNLPLSVSLLAEGTVVFHKNHRQYAAKIHTFPDGRRLLVAADITDIDKNHDFMRWMGIIAIFFMVLVILTSYLISRFVVENTNRIAVTAKRIMDTGDLSQRIDVKSRWDDLSYMSAVLNDFLERIEQLMSGIRQVSDNIAHDLRTPLTRLRNNLEEMKKIRERNAEDIYIYDKAIAEADHLLATFNALLRISRIETGKKRGEFRQADLGLIVRDVLELYEPLAEEKNIRISTDISEVPYLCDRDLLFQAFANLIDNAVKFTPMRGNISVSLAADKESVTFIIADSGSGIDDKDKPRVFERFYRAETSRHTPGSGLGLSLVAAAVDLHKGRIDLRNTSPGLEIRIVLPS